LPAPLPWSEAEGRSNYLTRANILELCVRLAVRVPGDIVEFGVATGASTRVIKRTLRRYAGSPFRAHPKKRLFALDSFEGLREQYENAGVGAFAGPVPDISGVNFVKGYFEETCTDQLRAKIGRVAFAHLDADLYSSTLFALNWLTPMLGTGSLLLFDEFVGGEFAEARAFEEWRVATGVKVIRVAEFDREPSGWGHNVDRRLLYQVVSDDLLAPRVTPQGQLLRRALKKLRLHDLRNRVESAW
jgi:hypothetical protein